LEALLPNLKQNFIAALCSMSKSWHSTTTHKHVQTSQSQTVALQPSKIGHVTHEASR
jgi:hypothetical protein